MKVTLFGTLLLSAVAGSALAQQQPQFTHYGLNGLSLSPAYAGIKGQGEITAIGRYQYYNYNGFSGDANGSPRTGILTVSLPILSISSGVGLTIYYDQVGESKMYNGALSYSYHLKLGSGKLGIGVQGIFTRLSKGTYRALQDGDPNVPANSADSKVDGGAGLWYESPTFYAGLGVNNLLRNEYSFKSAGTAATGAVKSSYLNENHAYITAGYNIQASDAVVVTPLALAKIVLPGAYGSGDKYNNFRNYSLEGGVRATINDRFWVGANYRHQESISGLLGASFAKDNILRIGYAFDFVAFNEDARAFGSHEILLTYRLPKPGLITRPAIRTPRYSF